MNIVSLKEFSRRLYGACNLNIKNLNWGGCGMFAYLVSEELDRLNIPYHFIITGANYCYENSSEKLFRIINYNKIKIPKGYHIVPQHIAIQMFDAIYINATRVNSNWHHISSQYNNVIKTDLYQSYQLESIWNCVYDKSQSTKMRKIIRNVFNNNQCIKFFKVKLK